MTKAFIDKWVEKLASRKLVVFIVGTTFLALGKVEADLWTNLAMVYIGTQGANDIVKQLKG